MYTRNADTRLARLGLAFAEAQDSGDTERAEAIKQAYRRLWDALNDSGYWCR